jgi:hypothetical protein
MLHSLRGYRANGQTFVDRKRSGYLSSPANLPLRTVAPMKRSDAKTISIEIIVDRNSVKICVSAFAWTSKLNRSHLDPFPKLRQHGSDGFEIPMFDPADLSRGAAPLS